MHSESKPLIKKLPPILLVVLFFIPQLLVPAVAGLQLTATSEYTSCVHTIMSATSNVTYIEKPVFPVVINNSQIAVGQKWTIIVPLQENHQYHTYFYGSWINTSAQAKTNYDVFVYDPDENLESSHTESAGLPPHLGTTIDDPLFTPTKTGNYSFVILNSSFGSQGAQAATFMIIENIQTDRWQQTYLDGVTENGVPALYTSWAYEFATNASRISVYINVPNTLSVYEARLYLMNNQNSPTLNAYPLAWEPGLLSNQTGGVGGYNFDPNGYRGISYASDEYKGQPLLLNYSATGNFTHLYHLVLIGKEGSGNLDFLIKTEFGNAELTEIFPPTKVCPQTPVSIAYRANTAELQNAMLSYTIDNWANVTKMEMEVSNQKCNATIPGVKTGLTVQYRVEAKDVLENEMAVVGNYTVKTPIAIRIEPVASNITLGNNITIAGTLTPKDNSNSTVQVQFFSANSTETVDSTVYSDGTFTANFNPKISGTWGVSAISVETKTAWRGDSNQLFINVLEPPIYVKYLLYIIIGLAVTCAVGGAVWFLKFREK